MNRSMSILSALIVALSLCVGIFPAQANTLPSSSVPASRPWLVMNPTTFQATPAAVLSQYDRVAAVDSRLTPEKRARLAAMLVSEEGVVVEVPDGISLDYLTGRLQGQPGVYRGMQKQLGRSDRALMFDLGDGVTLYWFTGDKGKSCNNIGLVITPPPMAYSTPPPPPKKTVCRTLYAQQQSPGIEGTFISSLYFPGCCCGPFYVPAYYQPGTAPSPMTIATTVCQ